MLCGYFYCQYYSEVLLTTTFIRYRSNLGSTWSTELRMVELRSNFQEGRITCRSSRPYLLLSHVDKSRKRLSCRRVALTQCHCLSCRWSHAC